MSEITNDIIGGQCCSLCRVYFDDSYGFPVVCPECWKTLNEKQKKGLSQATKKELQNSDSAIIQTCKECGSELDNGGVCTNKDWLPF